MPRYSTALRASKKTAAPFTIGVEEEYFVVDARTLDCVKRMPRRFHREAKAAFGERLTREILQSMIEISTPVCATADEALAHLSTTRRSLGEIARHHDLRILGTGAHPFADWRDQIHTDKPRYKDMAETLQALAVRLHFCGLHVHCAVPDPSRRIDVMNRLLPFLPLFLALSSSSPFWRGHSTGLVSYRAAGYSELPRSGLPAPFENAQEYELFVRKMVRARAIPDASHLWWTIRPSTRFPTLELRIADSCPSAADAAMVAALYQALVRFLVRRPSFGRDWRPHYWPIIEENRWRALRYGTDASFIDPRNGRAKPFKVSLNAFLNLIAVDLQALGSKRYATHARALARQGSPGVRQLRLYDGMRGKGVGSMKAIRRIAGQLADETERG